MHSRKKVQYFNEYYYLQQVHHGIFKKKIFSVRFGCAGQIWYGACQSRISGGFDSKKNN